MPSNITFDIEMNAFLSLLQKLLAKSNCLTRGQIRDVGDSSQKTLNRPTFLLHSFHLLNCVVFCEEKCHLRP